MQFFLYIRLEYIYNNINEILVVHFTNSLQL